MHVQCTQLLSGGYYSVLSFIPGFACTCVLTGFLPLLYLQWLGFLTMYKFLPPVVHLVSDYSLLLPLAKLETMIVFDHLTTHVS